jgi:phospholipase D1/2
VMPWLSPKVGVDTGDFETMLAVFQLNAGLPPPVRAYALPAIGQSDMPGGLGIGFSHHQKLVVIDQERAFVGGIDLAYGRRDDGKFSLSANGRAGNELYNSCIPSIHELSKVEQTKYLTRAELLAACFDGKGGEIATFLTSAPVKPVAAIQDVFKSVNDTRKDAQKVVGDLWATTDLVPDFVRKMQDVPVDVAQELSRWAYHRLDAELHGKLERLRATGSAHAANAAAVLLAWLNNASMEQLPANLRAASVTLIETFTIATLSHLSNSANARKKRYANLQKLRKMVPASGKVISSAQPRMPWHDVHSSITGPSVSDLCNNFIRRWNGIAHRYEKSYSRVTYGPEAKAVFDALGLTLLPAIRIPRLPPAPSPKEMAKTGTTWVQVLRSAPQSMLRDEAAGSVSTVAQKGGQPAVQNNCMKAMLAAIHGAQKFIYIEGQFFQSAYGEDQPEQADVSGPMAALIDITASSNYEKHARRLGIFGVAPEKIASSIRWSQVDDIRNDIKGKGADFMNDLNAVLGNLASIQASKLMGRPQQRIENRIGHALARRIRRAIYDGVPFHVYMVIPVHPEGTLNTLNIMNQLHLTMQSLVFGSESLVNSIRRALLTVSLVRNRKIALGEAIAAADDFDIEELVRVVGDGWKQYLTLLNLRNWESLEKRPVTEQIYVHSKLLIADDRVAVLGSANINDRSQLGNRDSELAVVIRDDSQTKVKLDGVNDDLISSGVHKLRTRLWTKLFGLMGSSIPANSLVGVISTPAAQSTWSAIQMVAESNAMIYRKAFPFLPRTDGIASSIWPTWNSTKRCLEFHMPFNERFWRKDEIQDKGFTWDANARCVEFSPKGVQGFIVALPVTWTKGENNVSGMNLFLLANNKWNSNEAMANAVPHAAREDQGASQNG